jgi:hypothetical protein
MAVGWGWGRGRGRGPPCRYLKSYAADVELLVWREGVAGGEGVYMLTRRYCTYMLSNVLEKLLHTQGQRRGAGVGGGGIIIMEKISWRETNQTHLIGTTIYIQLVRKQQQDT